MLLTQLGPAALLLESLLLLASCAGASADVAKWPWPHRGDVRAVITVAPAELSAAAGRGSRLGARK